MPASGFDGISPRRSWPWQIAIAAASMGGALVLTRAGWHLLDRAPFLLAFGAAVLSGRLGGQAAGLLAVVLGLVGYAWLPPPGLVEGLPQTLVEFGIVSAAASWFVARHSEIESDLRTSREQLRLVISSLPLVVWAIDPNGYVTFADGRGFEGLELTPGNLLGRSFFEVYRDVPGMLVNTRRVLNGETFSATVTVDDLVVETWYSPMRDERGGVTGAIGVSVDVTARSALERRHLQTEKMVAVGQLAGGIAHDFNNLLVAIGGYAELVLLTLEPSDARHADLLEIRKATDRAAALTRQLLGFSRRHPLQARAFDLNLLVANLEKLLRRTIGEDIDLVLNLHPTLDRVLADPIQLEQALLNLALNARDAMPRGGQLRFATDSVEVTDAFAAGHPPMVPGRHVRLSVADTGTGMTSEVQAQMFDPFFTTKAPGKGTGLGLALVYGVVKQSNGFIWADSAVGQGTTFNIYLPPAQRAVSTATEAEPAEPTGGWETILLAEDDGAVRGLMHQVLTRWGYTVLDARDGEDALTVAQAHAAAIHLVIIDVVMPGLCGRDLAVKLAEHHPAVRVLYTTGYATDAMIRERVERGLPFLDKPFLPLDLVRKVREVLDGSPFVS